MRVNARLDGEYQQQIEYLTHSTGMGVSDVLRASVAHYYAHVRGADKPRLAHLRAAIGKHGSGRSDVSANAKELFGTGLAAKRGGTSR
ncbi:MAG: hypothetical protein JSR59_03085 [Proteobacteria bacterium]|nr:hypothetical protein [Pseudomonadota bacterium]